MATFDKRLFIYLFITFIGFAAIGTLLHECGHYLVARCLGYTAHLHYGMTYWDDPSLVNPHFEKHSFYITLAGPLQTMLTGSIGLLLLFIYKKTYLAAETLSLKQWVIVFLTLFWLRQTVNFCVWLGIYLVTGKWSSAPDEIRLAQYLDLPEWSITCTTAVAGAFVAASAVFIFVPKAQRITFIVSGITGGISGYVLWLYVIGPVILP